MPKTHKKAENLNNTKVLITNGKKSVSSGKTETKKRTKTDIKKAAMIAALEKSLGIVKTACDLADCSRSQHYEWMNTDAVYRNQVEELENLVLDFAESKLHKLVSDGDTSATIFLLKTKGKRRGYIERTELSHAVVQQHTDIPVINWVTTKKEDGKSE